MSSLEKQKTEIPMAGSSQFFSAAAREDSVRAKTAGSLERYKRAGATLCGGVSSALRRNARPYPLYFARGYQSHLEDVDGNTYLDFALGWGPNILGNAPEEVVEAVREAVGNGLTFGAQHDLEYKVAELLTGMIPCAERVCFANSGTEIVQVALRLARAVTGRRKVLKFEGHYHGWDDSVLLSYHPSRQQLEKSNGRPVHEGAGQLPADHTLVAQWNDQESVLEQFATHGGEISAVLCEPLMCNSGCISPQPGFLEFLRETTRRQGALLIFDEVITGFRLGLGGAQAFYGVIPDLATYAKAIGAGTPLSMLAGKHEYLRLIEQGTVVHAGTLNGNPLVLAAAHAALRILSRKPERLYGDLHRRGNTLREGIASILRAHGHTVQTAGAGPVFHLCFADRQPQCYRDLLTADIKKYSDFTLALLDEGVLPLPDGRWYLSTAHTDQDVENALQAVNRAMR